jgi:hypothetical protein
VLSVVHLPQELVSIEADDVVLPVRVAVAAKRPQPVADDGSAKRDGAVLRGELLGARVLVLADERAVLEEVVDRPVRRVAARLCDDVGDQPRRPDELGRNSAGDHLLFLNDLGVQVGAKGTRDRVGHVDAVEVVEVVARHPELAKDVAVV